MTMDAALRMVNFINAVKAISLLRSVEGNVMKITTVKVMYIMGSIANWQPHPSARQILLNKM